MAPSALKSGSGNKGISLCSLSEYLKNVIKEEPNVPASVPKGSPSMHGAAAGHGRVSP